MGFFYNDKAADKPKRQAAPAKARLEDIPVATLRQMSCSVCPRDQDRSVRSPKMRPSGPSDAPVYLLAGSPSADDDAEDRHWTDEAMAEIVNRLGPSWVRANVRSNYTVQCRGEEHVAVTECCRGRVEADIEEARPLLVVTVGDVAFRWATGASQGATTFRGTPFVARFGRHECWVFPIVWPNYVHKRKGRKSQWQLCVEHDARWVRDMYDRLPEPRFHAGPFDKGIRIITGDQPGDIQLLERELREIAQYPHQALDIEATGLRPYMQRNPAILTAAVGTFEHTLAFPLRISSAGHDEGWGTAAREQQAMRLFAEYLTASGRKACHNLTFEMEWLAHDFGPEILRRTEWDDTMAGTYVLDGRPGTKSLDVQCRQRYGFFLKDQSRVDVAREQWWLQHRIKDILRYNGMDTKWTDLLRRDQAPELAAEGALQRQYERHVRLAPALVMTELPGLPVDFDYVRKLDAEMRDTLRDVEKRLLRCTEILDYERRHKRFEPTNNDMVLHLMKDVLKRPECEREDREGNVTYTTDEEALSAIPRSEVPSARLILEHREVSKLHGTYVLPALQKKWVCRDGRVRSKYSSLVAVTSRLNSEDPNVQNFPKRKHKRVRGMIYAGRGRWLVPCDYGQIEFRVVGMASGDDNLVKYCWTGYDVHKYWAERMVDEYPAVKDWIVREFEVDWDEKGLKTLRQEAKNGWVFPQLFGSTTRSCAQRLHLPEDVADDLGAEFWDEFRGVKKWQETEERFYEKHLYVETMNGHRRRGAMSYNELINLKVQGTAAEIVQAAHVALSERADACGDPELQPVLNVHDDLTFDIADENMDAKLPEIAREMCLPRFPWINVPLVVEVSAGARWDSAEEIKVYRSHELFGHRNPYV